ncbi:YciI family protein [Flaviaesturariibacter amylovorans]|uniref:YciI family protein n=1 Tax=Flaviaesturariibacter amylovorans TaxID=1084520 RepID=A0ABP8HM55_9BACT
MKNFMLLFRGGSDAVTLSPEDQQQQMQKWFDWVGALQAKGIYAGGEALMPTGKTVHKDHLVTDGPYAESKELVGGYFLVKAESLEAATEIAKDCPDLPLGGTVEVRDVVVFG